MPTAKRTADTNLHLTLLFLGSVDDALEACLCRAIDPAALPSRFRLMLDQSGVWPRSHIAWIAPRETPPALMQLNAALCDVGDRCGLARERRPYTPHVTLSRNFKGKVVAATVNPIQWDINELVLMESRPRPEGSVYSILQRWPLPP